MGRDNFPIEFKKRNVAEVVKSLENASLTLEEVLSDEPVLRLLSPYEVADALRRAESRCEKWVSKRGKNVSQTTLRNLTQAFIRKTFLEEVYRVILGYYGITGPETLNYTSLGYKVSKIARKHRETSLINKVKEEIEKHKISTKTDEKILKVIALATLKLVRYIKTEYSDVVFKMEKEQETKEEAKTQGDTP